MDTRQAVSVAKSYVQDVFADEGISNLGLEEVEYDEQSKEWAITLGFSRPRNSVKNVYTAITGDPTASRSYKVIRIGDDNGSVASIKDRNRDGR